MIEYIKVNWLYFAVGLGSIIGWELLQLIFKKFSDEAMKYVLAPTGRFLKRFKTIYTLLWFMFLIILLLAGLLIYVLMIKG